MTEQEAINYASSLYERRNEGVILQRAEIVNGDWAPEPNRCHDNVSTWCEYNEEYTPVRGWLYFDLADALAFVQFLPHSAVLTPAQELFDITPFDCEQYPFITANICDEEFKSLYEHLINRNLRHYK